MSTVTATSYEPDYAAWSRRGFRRTTPIVCKRPRSYGLVDVVYRESNGSYSAWIAQARSIWLVEKELITFEALQDEEDLNTLLKHFPPDKRPASC